MDTPQTPMQHLEMLCKETRLATYEGQMPGITNAAQYQAELERYAAEIFTEYDSSPYVPNLGDAAAAEDVVLKFVVCYKAWDAIGRPWPLPAKTVA